MLQTSIASSGAFLSEKRPNFSSRDLGKILKNGRIFMKTGLTKKQKVTEVYFDERDDIAEIHTHNTELKKRLAAYAKKYPKLCKQTDDDKQGGVRYEIDKHRISIHLVPPYSKERRKAASEYAKQNSKLQNIQ